MVYLAGGFVILFIAYKVLVHFGRKNALDVVCHNYKLDREKVSALEDREITALTFSLDNFRKNGDYISMENLAKQYR